MASVSHDGRGYRRLLYIQGGKRLKIHLGKMSAKGADTVKAHVEEILEAKDTARPIDHATVEWLKKADDVIHTKLTDKGLVAPRSAASESALGTFVDRYLSVRTDIKPRTRINLTQVRNDLVTYFGAGKPLADVNEGDADEWRLWLSDTRKLGPNSIRRHCGRARQLFRAAMKKQKITANPFAEMKDTKVLANKAREHFISRDVAAKVLEACPDAQWRLLFALSRFGGLRCPSEHLALKWADIHWPAPHRTIRKSKPAGFALAVRKPSTS